MQVRYEATDRLPAGVPAMVVDGGGDAVTILVADTLSAAQVCAVLTPLITQFAQDWAPPAFGRRSA